MWVVLKFTARVFGVVSQGIFCACLQVFLVAVSMVLCGFYEWLLLKCLLAQIRRVYLLELKK